MYTKQNLLDALSTLNINPKGTLMVHLSCKSIGEVEGRGDTVLDVLVEHMKDGLLVLPSHTWDNVQKNINPVMDVLYTPSCVGKLTELFRSRPGVYRSLHPTHSVAALGADAKDFVFGEEKIQSPCGQGGVYYKLWERNAQILLLGVNFARNTFIHGIEEWDHGKGCIADELTDLYVINHEGQRIHTPQHRHNSRLSSETFPQLEAPALTRGILRIGRFGDANARVMNARPLREMVAGFLKDDPWCLQRY